MAVLPDPPDPGGAASLDELIQRLRSLKVRSGNPSYETITARVNAAWKAQGRPTSEWAGRTTVVDCFRPGRRRLNADLVTAVVEAMHPDAGYVTQWRQALQVLAEAGQAGAQVRVQGELPPQQPGFVGRTAELRWIGQALRRGAAGDGAAGICTIAGMAGIGKTQLALRAGHRLVKKGGVERVLSVNLRGFHPESAQPPADPAAVLDGFLRLLGLPSQRIPHGLGARADAYRRLLAGTRTLVLLDNAADDDQVVPLLPATPGCPVLITSRSRLTALRPSLELDLEVLSEDESIALLTGAAPRVAVGPDPDAAARIARRCGHLPLALGLVGAQLRETSGWTLTDHADRLDEHRHHRRPDLAVALALDVSYERLPADARRLLRFAALHPGQDVDAYAGAALTSSDLGAAQARLQLLARDHLLEPGVRGAYTMHDLVRAYAAERAGDVDPPGARRAALTRLFDFYLAVAAAAMDILSPAEKYRRPAVDPPGTPMPDLADPDRARAWLDAERPNLVAVCRHAAAHGWPAHSSRLASTLFQYLAGGYLEDALIVHGQAHRATHRTGDRAAVAGALTNLGVTHFQRGDAPAASRALMRALRGYRHLADPAGEARVLVNLGAIKALQGRNLPAVRHYTRALALFEQAGHRPGTAHALTSLGTVESTTGRGASAVTHVRRALSLYREIGDRIGEAWALSTLGEVEGRAGQIERAVSHLKQALESYQRLSDRTGTGWALYYLGEYEKGTSHYRRALEAFRAEGDRRGEACVLNGLGEAALAVEDVRAALRHHSVALAITMDTGDRAQRARAHLGLGRANQALGDTVPAREHIEQALILFTDLQMPEAREIRTALGSASSAASHTS
ncbi:MULTISPECIES: ATP-binding protein [unclassified Micromonospora]|uniref:ATP-binding protein n=1 Tax=unclassified Micromonospora TaxID=2617518 RepID=UPI0022C72B93|nr:tetratricopeptide repeat protein [Micromonospora sp. AKA38]GHJ15969.1 hypothetical protein TPA0908_39640 [Micromonospora sp. AKA38]